jgi:hypothetical protein
MIVLARVSHLTCGPIISSCGCDITFSTAVDLSNVQPDIVERAVSTWKLPSALANYRLRSDQNSLRRADLGCGPVIAG